jgi:hypothetical protein
VPRNAYNPSSEGTFFTHTPKRGAVGPRIQAKSPDVGGYLTHDEEQHVLAVEGLALLISRAFDLYDIRRVPHNVGLAGLNCGIVS